jgi:ubiquinone biosynthesis protein
MTPNTATPEPSIARQLLGVVDATLELVAHTARNVQRLVRDVHADALDFAEASQSFAASAQASYLRVADTIRATPRFTRTLTVGLTVLASYELHQRKALFLSPAAAAASLLALHQRNADRVFALCLELGGGVLKLGQLLSCRADMLPEPWIATLSALQDRVPPEPFALIQPLLEAELGAPLTALFTSFDPEPLAAASLAQVHAATLADGRPVAVKIQRPGIADRIEIDIQALNVLATLFGDHLHLDLTATADALSTSLRAELSFLDEATQTQTFQALLRDRDDLIIPTVFPDLSTERVLIMEHIHGRRLLDTLDDPLTPPDTLDALFSTLIEAFAIQLLQHGRFHADPHPGNFLTTPCGRLVLLDFGCVGTLSDAERDAYIALLTSAFFNDRDATLRALLSLGFTTHGDDPSALLEIADMILDAFRAAQSIDALHIDPKAQIDRALQLIQAHPGFTIPTSFVLFGRVLTYLGGLLLRYKPRINLMRLILPHLP